MDTIKNRPISNVKVVAVHFSEWPMAREWSIARGCYGRWAYRTMIRPPGWIKAKATL